MKSIVNPRRLAITVLVLLVIAAVVAWKCRLLPRFLQGAPHNSIMVIAPYRYHGMWVFDDPASNLVREPFVGGVPEMIDRFVAGIPNAEQGFLLTFSAQPFPGFQKKLTWLRGNSTGNYYRVDDPPMEGWLCPALFRYYNEAPKELYVKVEKKG